MLKTAAVAGEVLHERGVVTGHGETGENSRTGRPPVPGYRRVAHRVSRDAIDGRLPASPGWLLECASLPTAVGAWYVRRLGTGVHREHRGRSASSVPMPRDRSVT
jgi:hypothetical protein